MIKPKFLLTSIVLLLCISYSLPYTTPNSKPVIGIIAIPSDFPGHCNPQECTYIKSPNAEFIEVADGIPIAIPWDMPEKDLIALLDSINGVMLTGGESSMWEYDEKLGDFKFTNYTERIIFIINYAIKLNEKGIYFPLYGVCQSHYIFAMAIHGGPHIIDHFKHSDQMNTLEITAEGKQSRMFRSIPDRLVQYLKKEKSIFYNHEIGLNSSLLFEQKHLYDFFTITANGVDDNGKEFIAAMEAKNYPIYSVQYHCETMLSEAGRKINVKYPEQAIQACILHSTFFLSEAKKNNNSFRDAEFMNKFVIANHKHVYLSEDEPKIYFYDKKSFGLLSE